MVLGAPKINIIPQTDTEVGVVFPGEEGLSDQLDDKGIQDSQGRPNLSSIGGYSGIGADNALLQSNKKVSFLVKLFMIIYTNTHRY